MSNTLILKLPMLGISLSDRNSGGRSGAHKIGSNREQATGPGLVSGGDDGESRFDRRGYRDLSTIRIEDVRQAYEMFRPQMVSSQPDGWIRSGNFCLLTLRGGFSDWPPALFGRVMSCSPTEGYAQNIRYLTMQFLQNGLPPDIVEVKENWVAPDPFERHPQSFCIRVRILAAPDEIPEFIGWEEKFRESGFEPGLRTEPTDFYLHRIPRREQPWVTIIGSKWFARLSRSVKETVKANIVYALDNNRIVLNFHADGTGSRIARLNTVLGFKNGITDHVLYEPANLKETVTMLSASFDELMLKPLNTYAG